jgi:hypothetical protein
MTFMCPLPSDPQINELCARIRVLCATPFSVGTETELRELVRELHDAIKRHLQMAMSSLKTKKVAIDDRDLDKKVSFFASRRRAS